MKQHDPRTLRRIVKEIQYELIKLNELFQEWERHQQDDWADTLFRRGKGSLFHDFYCGVENIFKRIAPKLNGGVPNDPMWQTTLLKNMLLEIPDVRPSVVSAETGKLLQTFLNFRHKFRLIYGFELEIEKMKNLDRLYPEAHRKFVEDINKFIGFLEGMIAEIEKKN